MQLRRILPTLCLTATVALAAPVGAHAATLLKVVGTSDVSDSNLMSKVIMPGFDAAFPQYQLAYTGSATGAAITSAENGAAAALIVHAQSIENQFVASGFSFEPAGRAIFYGDFVLAGLPTDRAAIAANDPHDAVGAFERIAQEGTANHDVTFVSRGGTAGTTVSEHAIWALTTGVPTCDVSPTNGGGKVPSNSTTGADTGNGNCPSTPDPPDWYVTTGVTQAPNVTLADACSNTGAHPFADGGCYVYTDRGTFDFLQSEQPPGITNLSVVTRDNSATAVGGSTLLTNYFHAYAINPSAVPANSATDTVGAEDFLNYLTSPAAQAAVTAYLNGGGDPPFIGDAAPSLTATGIPAVAQGGVPVTVTGHLANTAPATPALAGQQVTLSGIADPAIATPVPIASATTDANGNYAITFTPAASSSYTVSSPALQQLENATLSPTFSDLLAPQSASAGATTVQTGVTAHVNPAYRQAVISGTIAPGRGDGLGTVTVLARKAGTGSFVGMAKIGLAPSSSTFTIPVKSLPGRHDYMVVYNDAAVGLPSSTTVGNVDIPGSASLSITSISNKNGTVKVSGKVTPAPAVTGGKIELLAHRGAPVRVRGHAAAASALPAVQKISLAQGKGSFTITAHLRRGYRWSVELKYVNQGHVDTTFSRLRTVTVK